MVSSSFGRAVSPKLHTPGIGVGKPWTPASQVGLQAPGYRHTMLGLSWALGPDPLRTPWPWVLCQDPLLMSLASGPKSLRSCVGTQSSWVLCQDPRFLGLRFINIIIYLINIIIIL